jgi:hypothetical protein
MPGLLGSVQVVLDGQVVGSMPKPTPVRPWIEHRLELEGHEYTVTLSADPAAFGVEVFRDGESLLDGRSLRVARQEAPLGVTRFEAWTTDLVTVPWVADSRVAPGWLVALVILAFAAISAGFILLQGGLAAAILGGPGILAMMFVMLRTWAIAIARTRRALVNRTSWGDVTKLGVFYLLVLLSGIALLLAFLGSMLMISVVDNLVGVQAVLLRGKGGGYTIEMWLNRATDIIETAYPAP